MCIKLLPLLTCILIFNSCQKEIRLHPDDSPKVAFIPAESSLFRSFDYQVGVSQLPSAPGTKEIFILIQNKGLHTGPNFKCRLFLGRDLEETYEFSGLESGKLIFQRERISGTEKNLKVDLIIPPLYRDSNEGNNQFELEWD